MTRVGNSGWQLAGREPHRYGQGDMGESASLLPVFQQRGERGARPTVSYLPKQGAQKQDLALRGPSGSLRKKEIIPADLLSNSRHTGHMEPSRPQRIVLLLLGALMLAAWAIIIWVATVVTQTMLSTLTYIVDLAQLH